MVQPPSLFISYRRIDSNWAAVALRHQITKTFPGLNVFMDLTGIEPGEDFPTAINRNVDQCSVMLAIIGPSWLGVSDNHGRRRLDNPNDFVRLEITRSLERDIRLIPILVDGAPMPAAEALPEPLKALSAKNAVSVGHSTYERDFDVICGFLEKHLGITERTVTPTDRPFDQAADPALRQTPAQIDGPTAAGIAAAEALKDAGVDPKTMVSVAQMRHIEGKYAIEEHIRRTTKPLLENAEGVESDCCLNNAHNLAYTIFRQGRAGEAEAAFRDLLLLSEKIKGAEHPDSFIARRALAQSCCTQGAAERAQAALEPVPGDGGDPRPWNLIQFAVIRAFLVDLQGDAVAAEAALASADAHVGALDPSAYARRMLDHYRHTRNPGGPGGTTLWMLS